LFHLLFAGCCTSYYNIPPSLSEGGLYNQDSVPYRGRLTRYNLAMIGCEEDAGPNGPSRTPVRTDSRGRLSLRGERIQPAFDWLRNQVCKARYSPGETPTALLKDLEKCWVLLYRRASAVSLMLIFFAASISFAASALRNIIYWFGAMP